MFCICRGYLRTLSSSKHMCTLNFCLNNRKKPTQHRENQHRDLNADSCPTSREVAFAMLSQKRDAVLTGSL